MPEPDGARIAFLTADEGVEQVLTRALEAVRAAGGRAEVRNAGGTWVDQWVATDEGRVTSRDPGDPDAVCARLVEGLAEARHARRAA